MQVEVKTVGAGALEPSSLISLGSFSPEIIGTGFDEKEPLHGGQVKNQDRARPANWPADTLRDRDRLSLD
ncbi:hypothetical protein J0A67_17175 [Algoriphagus aestuariicola]|uniref:Uncharacterized protein n=1 Tax=Algoriphagus aestuariicola TaxID=1852016 RepID=A0ABS3BWC8_9BACT|nr:hypothetical protein [Algoriphagus aestuariicola]MBN7802611.1 hypothetical protein [Algoriphagus aestuariicola]